MRRSHKDRVIATRRRKLFKQIAGISGPVRSHGVQEDYEVFRFRDTYPRHACFHPEREWIEGATKRRVERQAPLETE